VICWDGGRPARNESEREKWIAGENLRVCDAFAGETPALPANRLTETLKVYE